VSSGMRCGRLDRQRGSADLQRIMTNNLSVSFTAFAGGLLFGFGSSLHFVFQRTDARRSGCACQQAGMGDSFMELCSAARIAGIAGHCDCRGGWDAAGPWNAVSGNLHVEGFCGEGWDGSGAAGFGNDSDAVYRGLPGGIFLALGCAGGTKVWRWLGAVSAAESVAVPAAAEGRCRVDCGVEHSIVLRRAFLALRPARKAPSRISAILFILCALALHRIYSIYALAIYADICSGICLQISFTIGAPSGLEQKQGSHDVSNFRQAGIF
jgi:hypothetical protein